MTCLVSGDGEIRSRNKIIYSEEERRGYKLRIRAFTGGEHCLNLLVRIFLDRAFSNAL